MRFLLQNLAFEINEKLNFQKLLQRRSGFVIFFAGLFLLNGDPVRCMPSLRIGAVKSELSQRSFVGDALERSGSAVVTIETQRTVLYRSNSGLPPGFFIDPYLNKFFGLEGFGGGPPTSRIEKGQGSGVIFSPEGLVLTNAHVIEDMDRLTVGLPDGRRVAGRVLGQDKLTDLAVVRLDEAGPWPSAPLGDSDNVKVGDWAIAVGNPFGLENTVTLGIVSNLNRNVSQLGISGKRLDLIQTDAAINPGNSGGPLLNSYGEVIGINTLVRSGPGAGLGFAIPVNRAKSIARQLVEKGRASHPMIGISLSPVPPSTKIRSVSGAVVRFVVPRGPADLAGMKVNDVIVEVGKVLMGSPSDVVAAINKHGVGKPLGFLILRGTRKIELSVSPVEMELMRKKIR